MLCIFIFSCVHRYKNNNFASGCFAVYSGDRVVLFCALFFLVVVLRLGKHGLKIFCCLFQVENGSFLGHAEDERRRKSEFSFWNETAYWSYHITMPLENISRISTHKRGRDKKAPFHPQAHFIHETHKVHNSLKCCEIAKRLELFGRSKKYIYYYASTKFFCETWSTPSYLQRRCVYEWERIFFVGAMLLLYFAGLFRENHDAIPCEKLFCFSWGIPLGRLREEEKQACAWSFFSSLLLLRLPCCCLMHIPLCHIIWIMLCVPYTTPHTDRLTFSRYPSMHK